MIILRSSQKSIALLLVVCSFFSLSLANHLSSSLYIAGSFLTIFSVICWATILLSLFYLTCKCGVVAIVMFCIIMFCITRLGVLLFCKSSLIQLVGFGGVVIIMLPVLNRTLLKPVLFGFAISLPLYGSVAFSSHSFIFECYLSFLALMLSLRLIINGEQYKCKQVLTTLIISYMIFSFISFLHLPAYDIFWKFIFWDWVTFWNAVLTATPEQPIYTITALHRLFLFSLFIITLASYVKARDLFKTIFFGLLIGVFWSSIVGILNYYGLLELIWFRDVAGFGNRLQSVFANPGWFSEFLAVTIPYILLGFLSRKLTQIKKVGLFGVLVLCEIAIILTYSRTGWLIYPVILMFCWLFFYITTQANEKKISWQKILNISAKVLISVPLTVLISYFLIFYVFSFASSHNLQEEKRLEARVSKIAAPATRALIWKESLELIKERPIFGFGYESFKYHHTLNRTFQKDWDTPHNFYLQLLVSGGIVGLSIWGLIVLVALYLLICDLAINRNHFNIAVILSIVAFHIYGLAQSMQYIPVIWFLIFLNFGYSMTLNENSLPQWYRNKKHIIVLTLIILNVVGLLVYMSDNRVTKHLAIDNSIDRNNIIKEQNTYLGFYAPENWGEQGIYRWTGSSALIKLPRTKFVEFSFVCSAPEMLDEPVFLDVYVNNRRIDEISFYEPGTITKRYYFGDDLFDTNNIFFAVSRTWNLRKVGVANDSRNLGVAISEPKVLESMPIDGIGFYQWEKIVGNNVNGFQNISPEYRWTGYEAVFTPYDLGEKDIIYLKAGQPNLSQKPLLVQFWQKDKLIREISITNNEWQRVKLGLIMDINELCILKVAKTWNPRKKGWGRDSRTLGVAVAGLINKELE